MRSPKQQQLMCCFLLLLLLACVSYGKVVPQHSEAAAASTDSSFEQKNVIQKHDRDALSGSVQIHSATHQLTVNGQPFHIRGVAYSPTPVGESPSFVPGGDYFTVDYQFLWKRDLPLIKAMGANTIRVYSWSPLADHKPFLDAAAAHGLYVIPTHYLGTANESPVNSTVNQQKLIDDFVQQVRRYGDHPALLMWMFGNELNGPWNGFMQSFSQLNNCGWTLDCTTNGKTPLDPCWNPIACVYGALFTFMDNAMKQAKQYTTRPMMSGFADLDNLIAEFPSSDRAPRFVHLLPSMDVWGVQLYRGKSFGNYFDLFKAELNSSLIVTEYGVDAYNDACGWPENQAMQPCSNYIGDGIGGTRASDSFRGCNTSGAPCQKPGESAQADYDMALAQELENQFETQGPAIGGFLMSWTDEYWKGVGTQDLCRVQTCPMDQISTCLATQQSVFKLGGTAACTYKAHISCPNGNTTQHDLCGYWLAASPDQYVNEEWFGITEPSACAPVDQHPTGQRYQVNQLRLRPVFDSITKLWGGSGADGTTATCDALKECYDCTTSHTIAELMKNVCQQHCGFTMGQPTTINGTATGDSTLGNTGTIAVSTAPTASTADNQETSSSNEILTNPHATGSNTQSSDSTQLNAISFTLTLALLLLLSLLQSTCN